MSKALIIAPVLPADFKVSFLTEGETIKTNLLAKAKEFTEVATVETRDQAIAASSALATHLKLVEKNRTDIKAPFYQTGVAIDTIAKTHCKELEAEKTRLDRLVGAFNAEQARILREQQAALEKERQRLANEAAEKQRLADEKLAAATKKGKPTAKALEAALDAENAAEQSGDAQRALEKQQMALAEQSRAAAATGGVSRTKIDIQITDIKALYAARPDCVRLEADLVQIKYLHAQGTKPPGVIITETPIYSAKG